MKAFIFSLLLLIPVYTSANTNTITQQEKAEKLILSLRDSAVSVFEKFEGKKDEIKNDFSIFVETYFDVKTLGLRVAGNYWADATDYEKRKYEVLYKKNATDFYFAHCYRYVAQGFEITGSNLKNQNTEEEVIVESVVPLGEQSLDVNWHVRNEKIIDVVINGTSMFLSQEKDFSSIIKNNGGNFSSLIAFLENFTS